jgi:hypothetical protein
MHLTNADYFRLGDVIMWNSKKYLAMAVVGAGIAVAAASPASAQWFGGGFGNGFGGGWGGTPVILGWGYPVGYGGYGGGYGGWGGAYGAAGYGGYDGYPSSQVIVLRTGGAYGCGGSYGCARPTFGCGSYGYVPRRVYGCGMAALHRGYSTIAAYRHSYAVAFHHPARVNAVYAARHHGHLYASYNLKRHYAKHGVLKFA